MFVPLRAIQRYESPSAGDKTLIHDFHRRSIAVRVIVHTIPTRGGGSELERPGHLVEQRRPAVVFDRKALLGATHGVAKVPAVVADARPTGHAEPPAAAEPCAHHAAPSGPLPHCPPVYGRRREKANKRCTIAP